MTSDPTEVITVFRTDESWITKRPDMCGGEACIRGRRFPVWLLIAERRLEWSDADILRAHPDLTAADLEAAAEYHHLNRLEIERALWFNTADAREYPDEMPVAVLVRGRQLGLSDEEIRETFEPPLSQETLEAAWAAYERDPATIDRQMNDVLPRELIET